MLATAGLEFTIRRQELGNFMREFAASRQVVIHFVGSTARDWVTQLNGTTAVQTAFTTCDRLLK